MDYYNCFYMPNRARAEQFNLFPTGPDITQPRGTEPKRHHRHRPDAPPAPQEVPKPVDVDESSAGIVLTLPRRNDGLDDEPNVPAPNMWKH